MTVPLACLRGCWTRLTVPIVCEVFLAVSPLLVSQFSPPLRSIQAALSVFKKRVSFRRWAQGSDRLSSDGHWWVDSTDGGQTFGCSWRFSWDGLAVTLICAPWAVVFTSLSSVGESNSVFPQEPPAKVYLIVPFRHPPHRPVFTKRGHLAASQGRRYQCGVERGSAWNVHARGVSSSTSVRPGHMKR